MIRHIVFGLLLVSLAFSFSIESYYSYAEVQPNGDLRVYENITFDIPESYSEGFRSIRSADYGLLDNLIIHGVWVNGAAVPFYKTENEGNAEIVWERVSPGRNVVELEYMLRNRVQVHDDFAKICFEHYGAGWSVAAARFHSAMHLPEETRGTEMHFEIYSVQRGEAYVDDLSVMMEMKNVPPGNYIGGCYLYDKSATTSTNTVAGSAYAILKDEREAYGSTSVLEPSWPASFYCFPVLVILFILAGYLYWEARKRPVPLPENILPPGKEEPVFVSVLVRNSYNEKNAVAATLIDLINRGIIDIVELEKKGRGTSNRERTILFYKKQSATLKAHEQALIHMLFSKRNEVDLDALADEYAKIKSQSEAKKWPVQKNLDRFHAEMVKILKDGGIWNLYKSHRDKTAILTAIAIFGFLGLFMAFSFLVDTTFPAVDTAFLLGLLLAVILAAYSTWQYLQPQILPKRQKEYLEWDAFSRAVKSSRLKEYPPSSAVIWGEVLVYATALGMADKVNRHLSELDSLVARRIEKLERVYASTYIWYGAASGVRNLSLYGNRSGRSSSGGFSSGSSGGWSSGGGGFGGGSSGGGGFR